jgi:hypothetical protein
MDSSMTLYTCPGSADEAQAHLDARVCIQDHATVSCSGPSDFELIYCSECAPPEIVGGDLDSL